MSHENYTHSDIYCDSMTEYVRRNSLVVNIGDVPLGGNNPIRLQSMTTTDTMDTEATIAQSIRMIEAGCEYVRITAPSINEAHNLKNIKEGLKKRGYATPLIADIHFTPNAAEVAARIVEKVRVNPGNYVDKKKFEVKEYTDIAYEAELERIRLRFEPLVKICKEYGTAMRIGTNHGSLSDRIMNRYGDTPEGMVESAMEFLRICESLKYNQIVLSMKASNPQVMVQAYRLLVAKMNDEGMHYPLHLGVTEAGEAEEGRIKSAMGIGALLEDGLGDTVRVSLTEEPEYEIPVARDIVRRYEGRAGRERERVADARRNAMLASQDTKDEDTTLVGENTNKGGRIPALLYTAQEGENTNKGGRIPALLYTAQEGENTNKGGRIPALLYTAQEGENTNKDGRIPALLYTTQEGENTNKGGINDSPGLAPLSFGVPERELRNELQGVRPIETESVADTRRDAMPASQVDNNSWSPFSHTRRETFEVSNIGGHNVPRVVADLSGLNMIDPFTLRAIGYTYDPVPDKWNMGEQGSDYIWFGDKNPGFMLPAGAKGIYNYKTWAGLDDRSNNLPLIPAVEFDSAAASPVMNFVALNAEDMAGYTGATFMNDPTVVLCMETDKENALQTLRQAFFTLSAYGIKNPVITKGNYSSYTKNDFLLAASADMGGLLTDGFGDGVWAAPPSGSQVEMLATVRFVNETLFYILQASRTRISKTEYISCPSCGRTLFDLLETTAMIRARTDHLKGVKIAIMGCIVNGPGEMADADYGYAGTGPGKITLYRGKDVIKRNIASENALDELINLIREDGYWIEKETLTVS